jgi:hypothetical protein
MIEFDFVIRQDDPVRPSVAVDIEDADDIDPEVDRAFREKLWKTQTYNGLLFTKNKIAIYEDLLQKDDPSTYTFKVVPTREVLQSTNRGDPHLEVLQHYRPLIARWLETLIENWNTAIPPQFSEEFFGVIPAAAEGKLEPCSLAEDLTE